MQSCSVCGYDFELGAPHCPLCYTPGPPTIDISPQAGRGSLLQAAATVPLGEAVRPMGSSDEFVKPVLTRWHATPTTFGPVLKLLLTTGLLTWVVWGYLHILRYPYLVTLIPVAYLLKEIWRKGRRA